MDNKVKHCCDCRDGEHENLDNDVVLVVVKDPDEGVFVKRGYICASHREMWANDGYLVVPQKTL